MTQRPAPNRKSTWVALSAGLAIALAVEPGRADPPIVLDPLQPRGIVTTPSHDTANQSLQDVRQWLAGSSDPSSRVRQSSAEHLMRLRRHDLPTVRKAVQERLPLTEEEAEVLHEVVEQAWMTEAQYEGSPQSGFLGIMFDTDQQGGIDESPYGGVEIRHRLPGFCASRYLQDGDVVLAITAAGATDEIRKSEELILKLGTLPPGTPVVLNLLRRGRLETVTVRLDARPLDLLNAGTPDRLTAFMTEREAQFEGYWEEQFQPLLDGTPHRTPPVQASAR